MMDTIKILDHKNTVIVAHRGLSGLERENTCAAFVAAGNRSYFGVETDVRKTIDGNYVLCHDDHTERNCIDKLYPEASTLRALQSLRYKDIDGGFDRYDLMMPTLQEYIKICKRYGKKCVLEFKGAYSVEDMEKVLEIIRGMEYAENMIYISFSLQNLINLRQVDPTVNAQWLTCDTKPETIALLVEHKMDLDVYFTALTKEIVEDLHSKGIVVNCWTVDRLEDAEKLIEMGVDQITSNILE